MPNWVKAIDAWTAVAEVQNGRVFRPVNRADRATGEVLSEKVVWQLIKPYGALHPMTYAARAPNYAAPVAASWSRSRCSLAMRRFRRRNDIWGRGKIWCTRQMMRSN